jgi:multidrug efflux pump subunit AcrA (membrane-fusion protein)
MPKPIAAALAVLLGVCACSGNDNDAVSLGTAALRTVNEVVEAPGAVTARASATITAPATGTVKSLGVEDGQRVRAGTVVLVIDSPAAEEQLRQAQQADEQAARAGTVSTQGADLSGVQRSANDADRRAFAAARKAAALIPDSRQRAAALAQVSRAEAEYAAAAAQAAAAVDRFNAGLGSLSEAMSSLAEAQRIQTRAALAAAERTVAALTVRAPIDGVVALGSGTGGAGTDASALPGQLPPGAQGQASQLLGGSASLGAGGAAGGSALTEGSPVQSGAALMTITDVSELSLTAEVGETHVLLVRPGLSATVEFDAVPGATYAAKVRSVGVSPTTSASSGVSYSVRLTLGGGQGADGDPAPRPRPGMSAVVGLLVRSASNAVAVPSSAVVRDANRDTLWVAENGKAHRRLVQLGAEGDAFVQVREGVKPGDQVVVRGTERVREGQKLQ